MPSAADRDPIIEYFSGIIKPLEHIAYGNRAQEPRALGRHQIGRKGESEREREREGHRERESARTREEERQLASVGHTQRMNAC